MRIKVSALEVSVGALVLVGFLGFLALYVASGGYEGLRRPRVDLYCTFNKVEGVIAGTPVRMHGIDIGAVKSVRLDEVGRVAVVLSVDRDYLGRLRQPDEARQLAGLGRDAEEEELERLRSAGSSLVQLDSSMISGNSVVTILHGHPGLPSVEPGDALVTEPVSSPLDDAIDQFRQTLRTVTGEGQLIPGSIAAFLRDDGRLYEQVDSLLSELNGVLSGDKDGSVGRLLHDEGEFYGESLEMIRRTRDSLAAVEGKVASLLDEVGATSLAAGNLLRHAEERGLLAVADRPDGDLAARLEAILISLDQASADLRTFTAMLPDLAQRSGGLLVEGRRTVGSAGDLVDASKRHWLLEGLFEEPQDLWLRAHDLGPEAP